MRQTNRAASCRARSRCSILKTLALEPMHGYGIGVRIEQISKGVFVVNAGSLFPGVPPPGARRPDQGRVARDREQPPREVLRAHGAGTGQAQTPDAAIGKCRRARSRRILKASLGEA